MRREETVRVGVRSVHEEQRDAREHQRAEHACQEVAAPAQREIEEHDDAEVPEDMRCIHESFFPPARELRKPHFQHWDRRRIRVHATRPDDIISCFDVECEALCHKEDLPAHVPVIEDVVEIHGSTRQQDEPGRKLHENPYSEDHCEYARPAWERVRYGRDGKAYILPSWPKCCMRSGCNQNEDCLDARKPHKREGDPERDMCEEHQKHRECRSRQKSQRDAFRSKKHGCRSLYVSHEEPSEDARREHANK